MKSISSKVCIKCGVAKVPSAFATNNAMPDKLTKRCRECNAKSRCENDPVGLRTCTACGIQKPLDEGHFSRTSTKQGFKTECICCIRKRHRSRAKEFIGIASAPVLIYALLDPRTGDVRYVGKTVTDLPHRLRQHINDRNRGAWENPKKKWLRELIAISLKPQILLLELVTDTPWAEAERFWIRYFRSMGAKLTNTDDGGHGGSPNRQFSDEARARMSAAQKARYAAMSPEQKSEIAHSVWRSIREKHPDGFKGAPCPEWLKEAHRQRFKGRVLSSETRSKISAKVKGRKLSESHRRQLLTRLNTPEMKEKRAQGRRRKRLNPHGI